MLGSRENSKPEKCLKMATRIPFEVAIRSPAFSCHLKFLSPPKLQLVVAISLCMFIVEHIFYYSRVFLGLHYPGVSLFFASCKTERLCYNYAVSLYLPPPLPGLTSPLLTVLRAYSFSFVPRFFYSKLI